MPRKRKRKNAPGAGRPRGSTTTGSAGVPPIQYRAPTAAHHAELVAEAARLGLSGPNEAAKRRTWPNG